MVQVHLKDVPPSLRWFIRPAITLSVAVHAVVLLLPLATNSSSQNTLVETSDETQVAIAPAPISPAPISPAPSPSASAQPSPSPTTTPPAVIQPSLPLQQRDDRPIINPAPSPAVIPSQPASTPVPTTNASPVTEQTPETTTAATPPPTPLPTPTNQIIVPFADFPHLAGSQATCLETPLNNCRQVTGNLRTASQTLKQQLESQGYTVEERSDLEETGQQIYEVTKDGSVRYLSVISSGLGETMYVLASEPVTQVDVEQIGAVKTQLETTVSGLANGTPATYPQFPYPDSFFVGNAPLPTVEGSYLISSNPPEQTATLLSNTLQGNGFELSQIGEYGGGAVYEVVQNAFVGYLSVLPTTDATGTIVVVWQRLPEQN